MKASIKRSFLKMCPTALRNSYLRNKLNLKYQLPDGVKFKIAATPNEYEQVFRLLHDCYVEVGLMVPTESQMRISKFNAVITSYVLIIKVGEEVVGTVTIIRDSKLGLPSDKILNLNSLRKANRQIAEISALAIKPQWRHRLFLHLLKYVFEVSRKQLGIDCFVMSCHGDWYLYFESLLLFERIEDKVVNNYSYANYVPVVGEFLDLNKAELQYREIYGRKPKEKNLYEFFVNYSCGNAFQIKQAEYYSILNTDLTAQNIRRFCGEKTNLTGGITDKDYFSIGSYFKDLNIPQDIISLPDHLKSALEQYHERTWRIPTHIKGVMFGGDSVFVSNVSRSGFQISISENNQKYQVGQLYFVTVHVGPNKQCRLQGEVRWTHEDRVGFEIKQQDSEWINYIHFCQRRIDLIKGIETPRDYES